MATPTPDSYPGVPGTTLYAGIASGGSLRYITSTDLRSLVGSAQTNAPITFGQPFKVSDFTPTTESLYGKIDGNLVPLQVDEISSFGNGSARFAVLSTSVASVGSNATKELEIYAGEKVTPSSGTFDASGFDPVLTLTISGTPWTASPRAQLLSQLATNTGVRLDGPVAKEIRVSVPFLNGSDTPHTNLRARFDVRIYANGSIKTDVIVENGWLLTTPADVTYSAVCTQGSGGATIFSQASFTHYLRTRWHRVYWTGTTPQLRATCDKDYFLDSNITWNYNRDLSIPSSVLTGMETYTNTRLGPMGTCTLTTDMPATGGRDEIAPVPKWTAMYLISQDDRAFVSMMRNADAAASAPIHFRDATTDLPVSVVARPNIAVRYGTSSPSVPSASTGSPWNVDTAHQGSYCFIPYIVTGDYFYAEEMSFWTSWNIAGQDPGSRSTSQGTLGGEQLRGCAWAFRSILECAYALSDTDSMKTYFQTIKNNNISWFNTNFGLNGNNAYIFPLGGLKGIFNNGQIPGYENDFFMYVATWGLLNGETGMQSMVNNISRYIVDRFTAGVQAQGFCTANAAHYWNVSVSGSTPITSWSVYATANSAGGTCASTAPTGPPAYSDWAEGYAAVSRGMLGSAVNAGLPNASDAWTRWLTFTPALAADFANSPQYDIVPR